MYNLFDRQILRFIIILSSKERNEFFSLIKFRFPFPWHFRIAETWLRCRFFLRSATREVFLSRRDANWRDYARMHVTREELLIE